ncbi:MAG: hypothetical protein IJ509_02355 [Bacilli bacterium]|nr:hypothetical protein [Bacilli bacterium]
MKTIRFILQKIIIVETMLIILYFACSLFGVNIEIFNLIINTGLKYLTPISVIALILYIILSLLSSKIVETIIGVVLGGIILYYLFNYII